jgi:acetoin utilization deacetylase AcuC-like enzyme
MNQIPVFFLPEMSVESGGNSPSASKPERVVSDWQSRCLPVELKAFAPATVDDLSHVHAREYVKGVLAGEIANGHGNTNRKVSKSCLMTVGSFMAAAEEAASNGLVACSPTSGFHHAGYDFGRGYCTFNGLMAAASKMVARQWSVAIIDCDAHFGDGTENILNRRRLQDHIHHWTYGRDITSKFEWGRFERKIRTFIESFLNKTEHDHRIVFYQAGADVHVDDPLGPGEHGMFDSEMRQRDRLIFDLCRTHRIPVVWNLAGGYQRDESGEIPKVLELHRATMEECVRCFVSNADD